MNKETITRAVRNSVVPILDEARKLPSFQRAGVLRDLTDVLTAAELEVRVQERDAMAQGLNTVISKLKDL